MYMFNKQVTGVEDMSYFPVCSQGEFSAILELPEGEHEYKFCVDGRWIHDPNAVSVFNETIL